MMPYHRQSACIIRVLLAPLLSWYHTLSSICMSDLYVCCSISLSWSLFLPSTSLRPKLILFDGLLSISASVWSTIQSLEVTNVTKSRDLAVKVKYLHTVNTSFWIIKRHIPLPLTRLLVILMNRFVILRSSHLLTTAICKQISRPWIIWLAARDKVQVQMVLAIIKVFDINFW